ncbi:MAG: hypothetical protein ACQESN_03545 [Thermotogota bacterium]
MKKYFLLIFMVLSLISFSYKIYDSSDFYSKKDLFYKTIIKLKYELIDYPILEADNLIEFTEITKFPYSYYNGATIEKNGKIFIMIIPFKYFKNQEEIKNVVQHELYHCYFAKHTSLDKYEQEGIILNLQKIDSGNDYLKFKKMSYEELIKYIKRKSF